MKRLPSTLAHRLRPRPWRERSFAERLLWLGSLVGLTFVFLVPPYQVADEPTHFYRAYEISQGHFVADRLATGTGDELPVSLSASSQSFAYLIFQPDARLRFSLITRELHRPLNPHITQPTRFENTSLYPPLAYAPQALGIGLGRLVETPPIILLYLARLAALVAWFLLILAAVRLLPRAGLVISVLALTPMMLYQAASAASDALAAAVTFAFIALVIKRAQAARIATAAELAPLVVAALALALCKAPYVLIVVLAFLVPGRRFRSWWQYGLYIALVVVVPLALATGWALMAQANFVNFRAGADQAAQLHFILHHPLSYLKVLAVTFFSVWGDYLPIQYMGLLGWLDTKLPLWLTLLNWITISLVALVAMPGRILSRWQTAWVALVGMGLVGAIATLLYLTWTPPKGALVEGLQGRYFLPLGLIVPLIVGGWLTLQPAAIRHLHYVVAAATSLILIGTLATVTFRYYS